MTFPWRRLFQSIQDDIEGIGENTANKLLKHFRSRL